MSPFLGMDTVQGRGHADRLRTATGEVEQLHARLATTVTGVHWLGADAEEFRGRWEEVSAARLAALCRDLAALSERVAGEAEQQDAASGGDGRAPTAPSPDPARDGAGVRDGSGSEGRGRPGIPSGLEDPVAGLTSDLAGVVSEGIGWGIGAVLGGTAWAAEQLGLDTGGLEQASGDLGHLGGLLGDWATGERVPTIAELGSGVLLATGSTAIAPVELVTDTGFLDPRTEVTVHGVTEVPGSSTPQDLADLVLANDEARRGMFGPAGSVAHDGTGSGQVRIQTVRTAAGGRAYIVHAPPTGGEGIGDPRSWGAQGNSAGWDSNLRSMAGQESAAMADIRAAMNAPGPDGRPLVPSGAEVMFVGHSQGGLTAARLVADPTFNSTSGAPGSYDVTHSFSVGSPVQTVMPAQGSTQVVNVAHDPVWAPALQVPGLPSPGYGPVHIADPVPRLDLDGYRVDGTRALPPNVQEAWIEAPSQTYGEASQLRNSHETVLHTSQGVDPTGGYYGSVRGVTDTDPVLSGLQAQIEGQYVGEGVRVVSDRIVEVGREDLR